MATAPTSVVPPNEVLTPVAIAAERWRLGPLYQTLGTTTAQCQRRRVPKLQHW